jgi:tetratricopeptide (TPR) repeat protein
MRFLVTFWAALAVIFTALAAAPPGAAQQRWTAIGQRLTLGADADRAACQRAASGEQADDSGLRACDRVLESRALGRAERSQFLSARGLARMHRREAGAALADFDAALALNAQSGDTHLNRAAALALAGEYGEAVAAITHALSRGVSEPHKAYFNRGAAREALGDLRGALEDYSTALEINPAWAPAEAELARFIRTRQARLAQALGANAPDPAIR